MNTKLKIGIIGIGDIAKKAYLPLVCNSEVIEPYLVSRNPATLQAACEKYHINNCFNTVSDLIDRHIDAAFVHTATEAHFKIVETLLANGIHVYVDKPLTYNYKESEMLVDLAEKNRRYLIVGFNRRFAPIYSELKKYSPLQFLLIQKNRINIPGEVRKFILDDFIHVIDTARFFIPFSGNNMSVLPFFNGRMLTGVGVNLQSNNCSINLIMNRDSGANEETLELMSPGNKCVIKNMDETIHYYRNEEIKIKYKDWDYILYRRGFVQIVNFFIDLIRQEYLPTDLTRDFLTTHKICEEIIKRVEYAQQK